MVNLRRIFLKSLLAIVAVRSFSGFTDLSHSIPLPSPVFVQPPVRSCTRSIFSISSSGLFLVDQIMGSWLLKGASRPRREEEREATKSTFLTD